MIAWWEAELLRRLLLVEVNLKVIMRTGLRRIDAPPFNGLLVLVALSFISSKSSSLGLNKAKSRSC